VSEADGSFRFSGVAAGLGLQVAPSLTGFQGGFFDALGRGVFPAEGPRSVIFQGPSRPRFLAAAKASAAGEVLEISKPGYRSGDYHAIAAKDTQALVVLAADGDTTLAFDGATFGGWNGDPGIWSIKGGAFDATTEYTKGSYLSSPKDYGSFRVLFTERKVLSNNHLGVAFWGARSPSGDYGANASILVITPPGSMWDYGKNGGLGGKVSQEWSPDSNPKGFSWHRVEVVANIATGEVLAAVNGTQVTRFKDGNPTRFKRGPIRLQLHGHSGRQECQYKDIFNDGNPGEFKLLTLKP
jgi:hypothetical protein